MLFPMGIENKSIFLPNYLCRNVSLTDG